MDSFDRLHEIYEMVRDYKGALKLPFDELSDPGSWLPDPYEDYYLLSYWKECVFKKYNKDSPKFINGVYAWCQSYSVGDVSHLSLESDNLLYNYHKALLMNISTPHKEELKGKTINELELLLKEEKDGIEAARKEKELKNRMEREQDEELRRKKKDEEAREEEERKKLNLPSFEDFYAFLKK